MPASTPLATGSKAMASERNEAKASQSRPTIASVPQLASRSTSDLMRSRAATPKLPAPDTSRRSVSFASPAARPEVVSTGFANAAPIACSAACWPSRSPPSARVVITSTARGALRETQTPCSLFGDWAGVSASAMRTVSPVGSRNRIGLTSAPAGVPSRASVSSIAARRPAALKRAASTAGLSA